MVWLQLPHLSNHSSLYEHLSYFQYCIIINNAGMNNPVHMNFHIFGGVSFGEFLKVGLLGPKVSAHVILLGIAKFHSQWIISVYVPTSNVQNRLFLQSPANRMLSYL